MTIAAALSFYRARAGMSQADLERASGVARTYVSEIERGGRPTPSFDIIARFCHALGVSLDEFALTAGYEWVESLRAENTIPIAWREPLRRIASTEGPNAAALGVVLDALVARKEERS